MRRFALLACCAIAFALAAATATGAPSSFEPASVTFVSTSQGWALGTVACGTRRCLALRETTDGGRSWAARPLSRALAAAADRHFGGAGRYAVAALNVRFADPRDGWIYGGVPVGRRQSGSTYYALRAVLWSTHDGGARWRAQPLSGLGSEDSIYDLEAARGSAWLVASNARAGMSVWGAPVGGDRWRVVSAPALPFPAGGSNPSASFVFADGAGWLVAGNDRGTTGSARLAGGSWVRWTPPCAAVGHSFAVPAASSARDLVAVCVMGGFAYPLSRGAPPGAKLGSAWLYVSADGGASFAAGRQLAARDAADPAALGGPIASPAPGVILLGRVDARSGRESLVASEDRGVHWRVVAAGEPLFIGFTSPSQGIVIMRAGNATRLLMSYDGGRTWAAVGF